MQNKANLQELFLLRARRDRVPVTMFLMNGFQMRGVITGFDAFAVILESEGRQQMIYKHAISTIAPSRPVDLSEERLDRPERPRPDDRYRYDPADPMGPLGAMGGPLGSL